MDHRTCRENLSAYLDGELPREEKALLESHLAGCPECGKVLAGLKSLSLLIHKHAMEPVPLSLKNKVFAEKREKPAYYEWFRPALAASMAAAGVLITLNIMKGPETLQAPAQSGAAASLMNASTTGEQQPLPAVPRYSGFKREKARMAAGSSLDMFKNAMPAAAPSGAGGGGGQAGSASGLVGAFGSGSRAAAPSLAEASSPEERASEPKIASVAAVRGSARVKNGSALYYKAGDKGAASAGKTETPAGAAGAGDAELAAKPARRASPVEEFIIGAYTAGDEEWGKKAVNRFKTAPAGAASEADKDACGKYAAFILDDGTYCIMPGGARGEFRIRKYTPADAGDTAPGKQYWDVFEYGGDKYLLLNNMARERKRCFEYYLLGPERIRLHGEIDYGGQ